MWPGGPLRLRFFAMRATENLDTWIPRVKNVVRDGFYKYRNGSVKDMADDDLYNSDPLFSN